MKKLSILSILRFVLHTERKFGRELLLKITSHGRIGYLSYLSVEEVAHFVGYEICILRWIIEYCLSKKARGFRKCKSRQEFFQGF